MKSLGPGGSWLLLTACIFFLLVSGYIGAYAALVMPCHIPGEPPVPVYAVDDLKIPPTTWRSSPVCDALFAPVHALDRRLRPDVWKTVR